jgi:hypothetical protein
VMKIKEYGVFCIARAAAEFDQLDALSDALLDVDGVVGAVEPGTIEAGMTIRAPSIAAAVTEGNLMWEKGLAAARILAATTISVRAVDADYLDQDGTAPAMPNLVGIGEIAAMVGLTRQRVSGLARSGAFPRPLADLKSGPVFSKAAVERFLETWGRKPGRPTKGSRRPAGSAPKPPRREAS